MPGTASGAVGGEAYATFVLEFRTGCFFSWIFGFKLEGAELLPPEVGETTVCSWLCDCALTSASGPSDGAFFFLSSLDPGPISYWACYALWAAAADMPGIEGGYCESCLWPKRTGSTEPLLP